MAEQRCLGTTPQYRRPVRTDGQGIATAAIRSERYYEAARPTPAQQISPEGLEILKRIQSAGEVAQLVLVFGPHAGETLGQVAKSDPDYLRRLALTAQRPDVRAAAARLVERGRERPDSTRLPPRAAVRLIVTPRYVIRRTTVA